MIDVGNGQPILFIHGLGSVSAYFIAQLELSDEYRILAFDLLGHGFNPSTAQTTLENMAKDQWAQVDQKGIDQIVLLGHSLGGLVAQEMHLQQPDRVKALMLANTYSYFVPGISDWAYFNRWLGFNTLTTDDYVEKTLDNCLFDKTNEGLRDRARQAFQIKRNTYLDACRAGTYAHYRDLLPKIKVPTLIISASDDQVTQPFVQEDMNEKIAGSKLVTIERCGHLSNIEKPLEFNEAIRNFLNKVGKGNSSDHVSSL